MTLSNIIYVVGSSLSICTNAFVMKLVDMPDLESGVERRVGSNPTKGTKN